MLQSFFLACMCHPEWIKSAQTEIDAVVGPNRLPNFSDREHMPYIEAVCRGNAVSHPQVRHKLTRVTEVLRWRPVARLVFG